MLPRDRARVKGKTGCVESKANLCNDTRKPYGEPMAPVPVLGFWCACACDDQLDFMRAAVPELEELVLRFPA